jgi:hypothetical protein
MQTHARSQLVKFCVVLLLFCVFVSPGPAQESDSQHDEARVRALEVLWNQGCCGTRLNSRKTRRRLIRSWPTDSSTPILMEAWNANPNSSKAYAIQPNTSPALEPSRCRLRSTVTRLSPMVFTSKREPAMASLTCTMAALPTPGSSRDNSGDASRVTPR